MISPAVPVIGSQWIWWESSCFSPGVGLRGQPKGEGGGKLLALDAGAGNEQELAVAKEDRWNEVAQPFSLRGTVTPSVHMEVSWVKWFPGFAALVHLSIFTKVLI